MFDLLVFDLDGTLVDSRQDLAEATNRLLVDYGGQALDEDRVVHMVGEGAATLVARAFAAAGLGPVPDGALARYLDIYAGHLLVHTRPYPGIPEALAALSRMLPLAVLTNKPRMHSQRILEGLGLAPLLSSVAGGDGPYARKPNPEALRQLAGDFGTVAARTLLVGDSAIDLRTARAAGASIALVRYGFGFRDIPREELTGTELVVDRPADLLDVVKRG